MRIKIFSDFCSTDFCKQKVEENFHCSLKEYYGENGEIYITINDDYTHAVILNKATPKLTIPKENVVGLAYEPFEFLGITPQFVEYAQKYIGKYLIGNTHQLPAPFIEHYAFMWYNQTSSIQSFSEKKTKTMSIVLSNKQFAPGHKYRHELVTKIQEEKLPIDIYGRGSRLYKGENVKGEFVGEEPYNDYYFTICIDNFQSNIYISEKIIDPVIRNCMPLYIGAKNISYYFQDIISLNGNIEHDMELIRDILENPAKFYKPQQQISAIIKNIDFIDNIWRFFG